MKTFKYFAALISVFICSAALAAPITYMVDRNVGSANILGSITTDGTLGTLGSGDILAWDLTLSDDTYVSTLTNNDSFLHGLSSFSLFSATSSDLNFNYGGNGWFLFYDNTFNDYWCLQGTSASCAGGTLTDRIAIGDDQRYAFYTSSAISGVDVVGRAQTSTIPEPATFALLTLGFAALGLSRRRQ